MPLIDFLNGKKTVIGAILFALTGVASFLTTQIPALQDLFNQLLGPDHVAQVGVVAAFLTQAFIYVGLIHKAWKSFFGLPDDPATQSRQRGFGRFGGMVALVATSGLLLACNKVPPNLSPIGATAFRAAQVVQAIDTLGDVAVKAERQGLIQHKDTLLVADVCEKTARAGADLGRALQAGDGSDSSKAKALAIIRKALSELPEELSPKARDVVQPYINVVLAALALIG